MIHCPRCGTANAPTNHNCVACGAGLAYGAPGYGQPPPGGYAPPGTPNPAAYPGAPAPGGVGGPAMMPPGGMQPGAGQPGQNPYAVPGAPAGYPPPAPPPGAYYPGAGQPAVGQPGVGQPGVGQPGSQHPSGPPVARASQPDRASSTGSKIVGFLVSFETNDQGDFWILRSGQLRVGRKDSADGLAVAIDHPTVSSSHAVLTLDPDNQIFQVEDTRSANGTVLNGKAIAGQGARELRDGDRVRFGGFSATIKLLG